MVALSPVSSAAVLAARATEEAGDTGPSRSKAAPAATEREVARHVCAYWIQAALEKAVSGSAGTLAAVRRRPTPPPPAVPPPPPPAWSSSLAARVSAHTGSLATAPAPVPAFPVGSDVEYYSDTHKRWICTRVLGYTSNGYELGCKPRASASKVRMCQDPSRRPEVRDTVVLPSKIGRAVRMLAAQCKAQQAQQACLQAQHAQKPTVTAPSSCAAPILREEPAGSLEQLFVPSAPAGSLEPRAVPAPAKAQGLAFQPFVPAARG